MAANRDDFIIAIRSAFLKKGTKQRFSLIALIFFSIVLIFLSRINFTPVNYIKISLNEVIYRISFVASIPEQQSKRITLIINEHLKMYDDYKETKEKIKKIEKEKLNTYYLALENERLKKLIDEYIINSEELVAKVLLDKDSPFLKSIIVNKGSRDNVEIGMAVLDHSYLVGKIVEVNFSTSRVLLISDLNSKIPVTIEPGNIQSILSGTGKDYGKIKTPKLNVRSFKVYGDGALGSRGATLKNPYSDDTSNYGELVTSIKDLEYYSKNISVMDFQMNTHAIGDSTISFLVKNYNTILSKIEDPRWRIEHSQVIDPNDFKLYNNKVLPSVQPTHATSDMYWADERLGERIYGAYAFKDLLNSAKKIALGTDFPVEKVNPFHTFYSSIERKDLSGYPENGFQKENSLNREETLKGMTIWGAYFNFEENEKGSLEIGKAAEFIIINQDIMEIDAKLIPETKVLKTFVDGEMVYYLDN